MNNPNAHEILKQILLGGSLEDKLTGKDLPLADLIWKEQALILPEIPGRTGKLNPAEWLEEEKPQAFPKKSELRNQSARGKLLHFFANHELLAIETMAYTLLKFPNAPQAFKIGVMKTIQDEQRHMGLYLERMREFGVNLGDIPLNFYFWKTLQSMKSPLDFVVRMSLTFEQANLDFSLEYAKLFEEEIADEKTAHLLRQVHDDEVKHVAHGLKWFNEWRNHTSQANGHPSEWDSFTQHLPFPITPRRAKGGWFFSAESRQAAGLSENYIENLRIAGGSRGKVPNYLFFNPQCEIETQFSELSQSLKTKVADLQPLLLWLAQPEDVVEIPGHRALPLDWLKTVHAYHGEIAERIEDISESEKYVAFDELKPWGWGKSAWKKEALLKQKLRVKPGGDENTFAEEWFSKAWWKKQLQTPGVVLESETALVEWVSQTTQSSSSLHPEYLLKSAVSTSGRGHLRFTRVQLQDEALLQKIKKRIREEKQIVIEPFLKKKFDFSVQIEIAKDGKVKYFEPRFFKIDDQFQYAGGYLGSWANHSDYREAWKLIQENQTLLREKYERVVSLLREKNYHGPVGIDALIYEDVAGKLAIEPIIEVNARYTMGRVAHEIERAVRSAGKNQISGDGIWMFFNKNSLLEETVSSFVNLETKLVNEFKGKMVATTPAVTSNLTWTAALFGENSHRFVTRS